MPESVFIFDRFRVNADRMVCDLRISDARFAYADTPDAVRTRLAERLAARFPLLPQHACINDFGPVFGACMAHASMPHLLEHVVIALQAESELADAAAAAHPFAPFPFLGKTRWTDRARLAARIEVNHRSDIAAFRAFRDGAALIDSIVLE